MFKVSIPGPFTHHDVAVDGWSVPFLEAIPSQDDRSVTLLLDRRIGITLSHEEVERIVPFLADAIAIASGFAAHPSEDMDEPRPFARPRPIRLQSITAVSSTAAG
jgi:hypothetical protein